ncbi:MAG TPA: DUF948 domain-containing protein [Caldithrix abyssi]|uniref:DUF948 domain-containing protein n=1 Tax=Caldithrix abyssi TaxID=187145 RepID=A0A7V5H2J2_CALAY|nr:DUF948 domain-containing protein [Caldisericaceae bacterium]HHE54699.1 DUF948 domain-containing protein [Caldithrix abyssi]
MTGVWEVAFVIFLLSLTVLVYLLIPVVLRFRDTLGRLNRTLVVLNDDLPEILKNVQSITERLDKVMKTAEDAVEDIAKIERTITKEIKEPLINIAQIIGTVIQLIERLLVWPKKK